MALPEDVLTIGLNRRVTLVDQERHRGPKRVDAHALPATAGFTTTPTADLARLEERALAATFLTDVLGSLQEQ